MAWTCLVFFSTVRCLIALLRPVDASAEVIMIYSQAAAKGLLSWWPLQSRWRAGQEDFQPDL